jgi:hypothetical protein
MKLFINGTQSGSTAAVGTQATSTTTTTIGAYQSTGTFQYTGYISNLRLVKGTAVYTTTFTPPTTPLTPIAGTGLLIAQSPSLIDNSPNAFAITKIGDTSVQRFNPFSPATQTPISYSGYFDGTGDYLTVPNAVAVQLGSSDFTIESWVYTTGSATVQTISAKETGVIAAYFLSLNSTNKIIFNLSSDNSSYALALTGTTSLSNNIWYHVAVVRSGSGTNNIKVYINGALEMQGTFSGTIFNDTSSVSISYRHSITPYYFFGYISNFRMVKGVAVYTGTFTPPTTPLAATQSAGTNISAITGTQTSLLTCQSSTFIDNSANAFTITVVGDSKPRAYNPFGFTTALTTGYSTSVNGGSAYFDGNGDCLVAPSNAAFGFGTGDFTVEGWFNFTGTISTYQRPWWFGDDNDNLELNTSVLKVGGATQGTLITGTTTILANQWYHVALTRASGVYKLWLNGVQQGSSATNSYNSSARTFTSMATSGAANPATGYVSNFRIVKGTAVYTSAFVPPNSPVTAITNTSLLLNATNAGIYDNAMIANNETVGNAQVSTTIKKYGTGSMFFDGTGDYLVTPSNQFNSLGTDFTIEAWVYPTVASATYGLTVAGTYDGGTNGGWSLVINRSTGGTYGIVFIHGNALQSTYGTYLTANTWTYIAVTRSGSSLKLYLNGTVVTTTTYATADSVIAPLYVGSQGTASSQFAGYIDDLRITRGYARTITASPTAAFPNS